MNTQAKPTGITEMFGALKKSLPTEISLDLIDIKAQSRTEFEDADNTLQSLADNIKEHGVISPILVRTQPGGRYELVAGERRVRAARMAELSKVPCKVATLTDEQAEDIQFFENTHRKNLTQMEEAAQLKKKLDRLGGDHKALAAAMGKTGTWISTRLSLLDLPPQSKRLVDEGISADRTTINSVKQIEKRDPAKAKEIVDKAAAAPRKTDLRKVATEAKQTVKAQTPGKRTGSSGATDGQGTTTATPRDRSFEEPSGGRVEAGDVFAQPPASPHEKVITTFVQGVTAPGSDIVKLANSVTGADLDTIVKHGGKFFERGRATKNLAPALLEGLHKNEFGKQPVQLFNLIAFVQGQAGSEKFDVADALAQIGTVSNAKK